MAEGVATLLPRWSQQSWMGGASCQGRTTVFFAPHAERPQARLRREAQARLICESCPSLQACRSYARLHREYGFWGGENEEDRAKAGYSVPWPIGMRRNVATAV